MHHPFSEDTSNLSVNQLYEKINELSKKYFQSNNPQVKQQMIAIESYLAYYFLYNSNKIIFKVTIKKPAKKTSLKK